MKKYLIYIFLTLVFGFYILSCRYDTNEIDCSVITGATFTSDGGKMQEILETKCNGTNCHASGQDGAEHWIYSDNYDSISLHFEHMYEAVFLEDEMPPDTATKLTEDELNVFRCWAEAGFPE